MIPIFAGFDQREEAGYHAFTSSVLEHASAPFTVTPLHLPLFRSFYAPGVRDGSNAFVYTRFLIPFLQGYTGSAIFCDGSDMLMRAAVSYTHLDEDQSVAVFGMERFKARQGWDVFRGSRAALQGWAQATHAVNVRRAQKGTQMKVLVTGSAGFIGSHVVERLHNAGYEVDGFDPVSYTHLDVYKRQGQCHA